MKAIALKSRFAIWLQKAAGWLAFLLTGPVILILLRGLRKYRVNEHRRHRTFFRELRKDVRNRKAPLLICANHLTMIDSVILQWSFGNLIGYFFGFGDFPWNIPAREVFANRWYYRWLIYLTKCIPIDRRGTKEHHEEIMGRIDYILEMGDPFIIFPEGGRSRRGLFDLDRLTYGTGRILRELPETRVLCVYLRSDVQSSYTAFPPESSGFDLQYEVIHPRTQEKGMRAERDLAMQVGVKIQELEARYFQLYPDRDPRKSTPGQAKG